MIDVICPKFSCFSNFNYFFIKIWINFLNFEIFLDFEHQKIAFLLRIMQISNEVKHVSRLLTQFKKESQISSGNSIYISTRIIATFKIHYIIKNNIILVQ